MHMILERWASESTLNMHVYAHTHNSCCYYYYYCCCCPLVCSTVVFVQFHSSQNQNHLEATEWKERIDGTSCHILLTLTLLAAEKVEAL